MVKCIKETETYIHKKMENGEWKNNNPPPKNTSKSKNTTIL
jgi:hypothetical protein